MRVDCQWIAANLEAYYCDQLSGEEDTLARRHMETCISCREEVQALRNIDPLIKGYFKHELSIAVAPRRRRAWLVPAGVVAVTASLMIAVVMWQRPEAVAPLNPEPNAAVAANAETGVPAVSKEQAPSPALRAKPATGDQTAARVTPAPAVPQEGSQEFLITDPAGYSRTLQDYRGYILLMGVWSAEQPQSIANLERLYQTFGSDTRMRILGVSNQRQAKLASSTFPVAYNQGSRLFGAGPNDFVLVDETGVVRVRGSLLDNPAATANVIRAQLR